MRCISIANQKGGVGKTTTAINLATALAALGWRTLLVDLDPQGNASTGVGVPPSDRTATSYDLLVEQAQLEDCVVPSAVPGLMLLPATVDLSGAEIELVATEERTFRLRTALAGCDAYDVCIIDPRHWVYSPLNALCAADSILVPLQCEFFALEGLSQLLSTVDQVQERFNPGLAIIGIALTMFDRRNRLTDQVAEDVRECLGDLVFNAVIPRNVRLFGSTKSWIARFGVRSFVRRKHRLYEPGSRTAGASFNREANRMSAKSNITEQKKPAAKRKLGRGLGALMGEARREEPVRPPASGVTGVGGKPIERLSPTSAWSGSEMPGIGLASLPVAAIEPQPRINHAEHLMKMLLPSLRRRSLHGG